ncbi:hypothetical protein IWZ03DRAFT_396827 [Phyllosticta citriasiana]|uniref:Glycosyltransferase family 28 N-terminal domain-containing protein n=1 Tax=Phyllosticta citriasiana TaxID=595635 RepID=A0ABR1KCI4_9PEZI
MAEKSQSEYHEAPFVEAPLPYKAIETTRLADENTDPPLPYSETAEPLRRDWHIKLNIVIQVVGSRGDKYRCRVRIATHNVFEDFLRGAGLQFYPISRDPADLMAYMVKIPGLIPGIKALRSGNIGCKRVMIAEMLDGCWKSCIEADQRSNAASTAEPIIGDPPAFAPIHRAEELGVPIYLMFAMPWTSTRAVSHPLANIRARTRGLGDVINKWRVSIDLEPIPITEGPNLAKTLKPADWQPHIDVCSFFFRDPPARTPPPNLELFLHAGPPTVYISFGSIILDDPACMTALPLGAITPTTIVPFFGDQPFWGDMVAAEGAGPSLIPHRQLDSQNLTQAITYSDTFHAHLPLERNPCDLIPNRLAFWVCKKGKTRIRLSKLAAGLVASRLDLNRKHFQPYAPHQIVIETRRWDPPSRTNLPETAVVI